MYRRIDDVPERRYFSEVGSRVKKLYKPRYDDDGMLYLVEAGEHNLYDEIQSHRDGVDLKLMLARYQAGDIDALQRVQGMYGDFTQMPKTYAEMLNLVNDGKNYFSALSPELRSKFNNDFNQFIASMGTAEWFSKLGLVQQAGDESMSASIEEVQKDGAE